MAELLYRLGKGAARRAWVVIVAWVLALGAAGGAYALFGGTLTSSFDVPGTASGEVLAELEGGLPEFAGASGTVVFTTDDGSPFTDEQRAEISDLVAGGADLDGVEDIADPFATQQQLDDQRTELEDGAAQLEAGRAQLEQGQQQLDGGRGQLEGGIAQLEAGIQQAEAAGAPAEQLAALEAQLAPLQAQLTGLGAQQDELDAGRAELDENAERLDLGERLLAGADGIGLVADDEATAIANVSFADPRMELEESIKQGVIEHFEATAIDGVDVAFSTEIAQGVPEIFGIGEAVGLVIAAIVLIVMLGFTIAAAFPIMTAIVGVGIGVAGALAFSGVVQMASVTPVLGVMLGLAVGIDYALFVISRHRRQVLEGAEVHESIGLANGTAGNAVVFAGATVVVALLALNVTGVPFLGLMGTVGAVCVAIAVLISVTFTPALLGLLGERVLTRRARSAMGRERPKHDAGVRPMPTWRAIVTVLATAAALLTIAIPALSLRVGLPDGGSEPEDSASYRAYVATTEAFGAGANGPLLVTADLPGDLDELALLEAQVDVAETIGGLENVEAVAPVAVSDDERLAAFQVVPTEGPNSQATDDLVRELRELPPVADEYALGVAGQAAINIDISENLVDVLPLYLAVVVGLSLLIMIVVFRSLLVPLIATGGFILSLLATYGATVAVFQWGWFADLLGIHATGPILSFLPVILVGILFGLAMDYQLFLASGMREAYVHGAPARTAVMQGFRAGRSVVTAAALIMISVFGGFVFADSMMIRSIGFGLAFGVLLDAFVVRMLLMPALMHLLGRSAWWMPRWLDRILPDVDVEGAKLERAHHAPVADETRQPEAARG